MRSGDHSATVDVPESSREAKGKAPLVGLSHPAAGGLKRGFAIFDLIVRICAIVTLLAAAAAMGTTDQTLPFFTQFFQFQASYDDLPTFQYFVIGNAIAAGYLVLSLPFSIVSIVRPYSNGPRLLLVIFDTIALALTTSAAAAAAAAAAIVYLAHNGNQTTNWIAICQQFGDFCSKVSGATVASFIGVVLLMVLIMMAGLALRRA